MPLYFPDAHATFIHIPKNAGNSLEQWAIAHNVPFEDKENHCTLEHARTLWNNLGTTFSFVRNPFSRTVSMFHYLGQRAESKILEKRSIDLVDDLKTVALYKKGFDYWLNCLYDTSSEFIEKTTISNVNGESHWPRRATQSSWFASDHLDFFIKVENLEKDFVRVAELLNCGAHPTLNITNQSNHGHYKDYYSEQNINIVRAMFKEDLDKFNYDY